jgi:hypothetical protein
MTRKGQACCSVDLLHPVLVQTVERLGILR